MLRPLLLLFSCSLAMAGPWEDCVRFIGTMNKATWTLCVTENLVVPGELLADEAYLKLASAGDWSERFLGKAEAEDLKATLGAQWALLAPGGGVAGTGKGRPTGAALLQAIHASGARSTWEIRAAFLQEHPDHGEAREDLLAQELFMLIRRLSVLDSQGRARVPGWSAPPGQALHAEGRVILVGLLEAQAQDVYRGVGDALGQLLQVPGWTRAAPLVTRALERYDLGPLPGLLGELARELEDRAAEDPGNLELLRAWGEAQDLIHGPPGALASRVVPVPGTTWPPPQGVAALLRPLQRRRDFDGIQKLLGDLTPPGPPDPPSPRAWEEYCELQATLQFQKACLLASQGVMGSAQAALDEARTWGGSQASLRSAVHGWMTLGGLSTQSCNRLFSQPFPPKATRPAPPKARPVLVLTLLGRPPWLEKWAALGVAPELAPWSPGELRWEIASPAEFKRQQALRGWGENPRWVLFRGTEVLATGEACPGAPALAGVLAGQGTPQLERLGRLLVQNPGHMAARRARFALVLNRMPDPRLEPLLVEDAAAAGLALPFAPREGWKPDEALWGAAAQRVLPNLEAELRSWPSDEGLWKAWTSWARFHPARPSILQLVGSLAWWRVGEDWRAGLPNGVLRTVAAELRRQGSYPAMIQ